MIDSQVIWIGYLIDAGSLKGYDFSSMRNSTFPIRAALFFVSLSVILWEILLTRIYSVLLYYHFAFMAVSGAMFGLTIGAILIFLTSASYPDGQLEEPLGQFAFLMGMLMASVIVIQISLAPPLDGPNSQIYYLIRTFLLSILPFVPAGAFICLVLTRFKDVGRLYTCDLTGAGIGCGVLPLLLGGFGGPGAVLVAAAMSCAGGSILSRLNRKRRWGSLAAACALLAFAGLNNREQWLRIRWRHDGLLPKPLYEAWNAYSRIMVTPWTWRGRPFGWGIDPELNLSMKPVDQLYLQIDSGAGTPMTHFDGHLGPISFLKYDLTGFAHYLRPQGPVLIIGPGGGRDILTALQFQHERIQGVEVNGNILWAVNHVFGDFTGHLDKIPSVRFAADEGRSYVERSPERFEIIQASLVDTVAATAAGAYAFVENGLYTVEAWRVFLGHLRPRGILTFSRWYLGAASWPVEVNRTIALACAALRAQGVQDLRSHILVIRTRHSGNMHEGLATLLVSPDPFSDQDIRIARDTCQRVHCEVAYSRQKSLDTHFTELIENPSRAVYDRYPLDVTPPTDDRPYFFFHTRIRDILKVRMPRIFVSSNFNIPAISLLVTSLFMSLILGGVLVLGPVVWLAARGQWSNNSLPHPLLLPVYFAGIGLAYMFIEMAFMQRLSLYLGHPTYGFTVALFGLLLWNGLGSWLFESALRRHPSRGFGWVLPLLGVLLVGMEIVSRKLLERSVGVVIPWRILFTLGLMAPPAILMGFCFPMGMRLAHKWQDSRAGWYWAINGAASVIASVLAMMMCFSFGIRDTLWMGIVLYSCLIAVYQGMSPKRPIRSS